MSKKTKKRNKKCKKSFSSNPQSRPEINKGTARSNFVAKWKHPDFSYL